MASHTSRIVQHGLLRRCTLALMLSAFTVCHAESAASTQTPMSDGATDITAAPLPEDMRRRVSDFLRSRYVPQAGLDNDWEQSVRLPGPDHDGAGGRPVRYAVCMQPFETTQGNSRLLLLAVCGTLVHAAHPEQGLIDFYLLHPEPGSMRMVASGSHLAFGSFGSPGTVNLMKLGSGESAYAFRVVHQWMGQGIFLESQSLVAANGPRFEQVATVRNRIENSGFVEECGSKTDISCPRFFDLEFRLDPETGDGTTMFYPLRITEHGVECGKSVNRDYLLAFDPVRFRYPVPKALVREGCLADDPERTTQASEKSSH